MNERVKTIIARLGQKRFSLQDQALFAKRLSFLLRAGVPIAEGLKTLAGNDATLGSIVADVENGHYLATAAARHPRLFGTFAVNIIRIGEASGGLVGNLEHLALELKKRHELRRAIIGALVYPLFITIATLGVAGMITAYIFPKIMPIFQSVNIDLPWSTRLLIAVSAFLGRDGFWLIVILGVGVVALVVCIKKYPQLRALLDRILLSVPVAGRLARAYSLATLCRTIGLLLASGLGIGEALAIAGETAPNALYRRALLAVADAARAGASLSAQFGAESRLFPEMTVQVIAAGERSGSLSEAFLYLSDMHESELADLTKNLSSSIEPLLMILMGLIVGFVAVSVITPIYEITQKLSH